jgi:hypothetical protein
MSAVGSGGYQPTGEFLLARDAYGTRFLVTASLEREDPPRFARLARAISEVAG